MSKSLNPTKTDILIYPSPKFYGHYQVVVLSSCGNEYIDCHNIGTARSIRDRLLSEKK